MPRQKTPQPEIGFKSKPCDLPYKFVDLSKFKPDKVRVKVNDVPTDLNIGDAILIEGEEEDKVVTIGGIIVSSDKTVAYVCEINNGMEIVTQTLSIFDLQRLQARI